jgi:acetyl-CoA synthetase
LTKPHAFIVAPSYTDSSTDTLEQELQDWVKSKLEPYKYPRKITFLDELPMTHLGKVNRGELRNL